MSVDWQDLSAIVAEQVQDFKRRLDVRFATIEESRMKVMHNLELLHQEVESIRKMLEEMRMHLSIPGRS